MLMVLHEEVYVHFGYLHFINIGPTLCFAPGPQKRRYGPAFHVTFHQPVREAVSYRGLFTAGWFGVREKHCSRLKIYDRLRAS